MKYDLHIHSRYSTCSNSSLKDIIKKARKTGLDGIAITDHNLIKGALEAKKLNKNKDFEVIVSSEIKTDNGEVLAYYISEEVKPGRFEKVIDKIREQGGLVAISHPYSEIRKNLKRPIKVKVDAIECFNPRTLLMRNNLKAEKLAEKLKVAKIAGSDAHFTFEIGKTYTLFEGDLRKAILKRKTSFVGINMFGLIGVSGSAFKKRVLNRFIKK